ncbi:uncharacterized protein LOC106661383 [Cimex lectularius]|uniref:HTH CENPB-type domain-containing protein n=1 Tax=Cimex lectularius TaxID=79782 RepID=A0A8I6TCW2_CIMLE|nr:uncharacterized protein LOC106661383 [Cimex lectularius]
MQEELLSQVGPSKEEMSDLFEEEFKLTPLENIDLDDSGNVLSDQSCSSFLESSDPTTQDCKKTQGLKSNGDLENRQAGKKWGDRYLPQFKSKVISFALKNSIREAVSVFKVNKGTVADWLRTVPRKEKAKPEENIFHPDVEFLKWLHTERICGHLITKEELGNKIAELFSAICNMRSTKTNLWFFKYATRLQSKTEKGRITYPRKFKKEIALLCNDYSKKKVGMIFKIDRKRITEWIECYVKEEKPEVVKREPKHYLTDEKVDNAIWSWYQQQSTKPNSRQIRETALKMYHAAGHTGMTCSTGWYYRWRKRYSLVTCTLEKTNQDIDLLIWVLGEFERNRTVLHADLLNQAALLNDTGLKPSPSWAVRFSKRFMKILQQFPSPLIELPAILERQCFSFQNMIATVIADRKLPADLIVAIDEIPLNFMTSGSTKSVTLLRKSGFDNSHASLIICCRADGTFLPTTLITKSPIKIEYTEGKTLCFSLVQENGINDKIIMEKWFFSMIPYIPKSSTVICDIYEPHLDLDRLCRHHDSFEVAIIPLGCSPKLQPIAFGIAQKFKDEIEKQWLKWQHECSWKAKGIKVPSSSDMFTWVENAHNALAETEKKFVEDCFFKAGYFPFDGEVKV